MLESCWVVFSLTERTEVTEVFGTRFELTERLRHTEVTEAFQLRLAVTLCELCMPEAFCGLEMCAKKIRELCALCERKNYPRAVLADQ